MFFLLGGNDKKNRKSEPPRTDRVADPVRELFLSGKFPVVTVDHVTGRQIAKVLGLVCCRGYDSEEAFFGMASRAVKKGAHAIVGYCENVAFHPDGSKYFSCFGTAVMFEWEQEEKFGAAALLNRPLRMEGEGPADSRGRMLNRTVSDALADEELRLEMAERREAAPRDTREAGFGERRAPESGGRGRAGYDEREPVDYADRMAASGRQWRSQ